MTLDLKIEILKLFNLELHFNSAKKEEENEEVDTDIDPAEPDTTDSGK